MSELRLSPLGEQVIKGWEGLRLIAYRCSAGVWTIGWGHTNQVFDGMKITLKMAEYLFKQDVKAYEDALNKFNNEHNIGLIQEEFDALVAFSFNVGNGSFAKSTMRKHLENNDDVKAALEFDKWNKAAGKISAGLANRRNDEEALFVKGLNGEQLEEYEKLIHKIIKL